MYRHFEDRDADALARAQANSFGMPESDAPRWWSTAGRENLRVWDDGATVRGGLVDIPMGMFAGGRSVPCHGVAGVAVAPEHRGRGTARSLMATYLEELAGKRIPLSALYASTRGLYRSVGFGIAGNAYIAKLDTDRFRATGDRASGWRPIEPGDWPAIEGAYTALARHRNGAMDRGPYLWARVRETRGTPNAGWILMSDAGRVDAWLVTRQSAIEDGWQMLHVVDHGARTPEALARVAGLISTFGSIARRVELRVGIEEPLLDRLAEHHADVRLFEPWLLRVVDVEGALRARGWAPGFDGTLDLRVQDGLIHANDAAFRVHVRDGEASVERGGDGTIAVDIRALAGLFTGHANPFALRTRGLVHGPTEALVGLSAAFAGPAPSLTDFF